ncbi:MAG: choice-of-anchor Q domain-containing protein, partial [Panacagrimonas sp.]
MNPITRTGAGALLLAGLGLSTAAQASTFTVTNLNDDDNCSVGYCTLRGAVNNANLNLGDDVVDATGIAGTITLNGTEIEVTDNVTIVGPGAQVLAVSGNDRSRIFNVAASGTLSLADLTLTGGRAPDGSYGASGQSGGAILSAGTLSINHCTLSANQAGNSGHNDLRDGRGGGGGAIASSGTLSMTNSTLSANRAGNGSHDYPTGDAGGDGGAIASSGTLNITNSTLSANQAGNGGDGDYYGGGGGNGGAIASSGTLSMTNSTLSDNRTGAGGGGALGSGGGGNGGGIFTSSPMAPALANSLLANNGSNCWGTPTDDGGNLDDGSSCGFTALTSLSNAIANLGPLQDNGGPTQTYALLAGSAAIDAGIASACTGTDQRGVIRPQGPACDIGAFELEPASRYTLSVILAGTGSG